MLARFHRNETASIPMGVPHLPKGRGSIGLVFIMSKSLFKFSDVEAKKASPATTREIIRSILKANDDACATELERFMMSPGVAGSREYDHAYAVGVLLAHDADHGGALARMMADTPALSRRMLWDWLVRVYVSAGFQFKHGRMVGLLEDKSSDEPHNGADREDGIE
jgi:hypothetical protein